MFTIPQRFYVTLLGLNLFRFPSGASLETLHPRPEGRGFQKSKEN